MTTRLILKVLVGSRAHGLAHDGSDYDYRGVFIQPTKELPLIALDGKHISTEWLEKGRDPAEAGSWRDDTSWEIAHFLKLAVACNPSILETFTAPIKQTSPEGDALRELFPAVWHPARVAEAAIGYGENQRTKMLAGKDARPEKFAVAYLRTLIQAEWLLRTGVLLSDLSRHPEFQTLLLFRNTLVSPGQVIDKCTDWTQRVREAVGDCKHKPDLEAVADFLLSIRKTHW